MSDIKIKNRYGQYVNYDGVETIKVPYKSGSGDATFGAGGGEPEFYLKDASVNGNTLTITKKDDSQVNFTNSTYTGAGKITITDQNVISTTASEVSVSDTGTATDEVQYITVNGVEKKLAGGGGGASEWDEGYTIEYVTESSNNKKSNSLTTLDGTSWNFKDQFFTEQQLEELAAKAEEMEFNEDLLIIANVKVCKGSEVLYDFVFEIEYSMMEFTLYAQNLFMSNNKLLNKLNINTNDLEEEIGVTPCIYFEDRVTETATIVAGLNSAAASEYSLMTGASLEPGIYSINPYAEEPSDYFIWLGSFDEISFNLSATNVTSEGMSIDDVYGVNHPFPCYFFETYCKEASLGPVLNPPGYYTEFGVPNLPIDVDGYNCMGWYDNQQKTGNVMFDIPVNTTGDKTLYINDNNYNDAMPITVQQATDYGYIWEEI